ncbi:MAG: DJ-1/PfpI family protein [Halorhodospira sp.]
MAGRTYTSSPALIDDLRNAGAQWVDQEVAVDGTHISSRRPDDLPAFCAAVLRVVETL